MRCYARWSQSRRSAAVQLGSLARRAARGLGDHLQPEVARLGMQLDFGGALVEGSTA